MAAESNSGFHHNGMLSSALNRHAISFQSTATTSSSEMMAIGNYFGVNNASTIMFSGNSSVVNNNNNNHPVISQSANSSGSLHLDTVPGLKNDAGLAVEWSVEEQFKLEESLVRFADEPSILKYIKIAAMLRDKTVRDVALRCRWMSRKRRKPEEHIGKKVNNRKNQFPMDIQDKLVESSLKINTLSAPGPSTAAYSHMMHHMNRNEHTPSEVSKIGSGAAHLLEQNAQAFRQITANLSMYKLQDNIDLFCRSRNNIIAILNNMRDTPGIMSKLLPLPVSINEDLANRILPSTTCFCFSYAHISTSIDAKCHPADLKALKSFLDGLHSPVQGWDYASSDCCNWKGVTCDRPASSFNNSDAFSRVVALELPGKRLKGNVSESLADLVRLRTVNLSANFLTGSLPLNLFFLQNLEVVDLSFNDLSGYLPLNITSFSITILDISKNRLTGDVDPAFCQTAKHIQVLKLSSNRFHGKVLPGFGNCSSLEHLFLSSNFLSGNLPQDLFKLSKLKTLDLSDNGFSGELSFQLGNLSNLVFFDISFNQFSTLLPDVFFDLQMLEQFAASSNNFTGALPVSLCNSPTVSSLSLHNNSLSGSIDAINCSAMVSLTSLNLGSNHFVGQIGSLSSCHRLRIAILAHNRFHGNFLKSFKNLKSLSHLGISRNGFRNLSAALTTLQHCRNLTMLVLTFNFYGEIMPINANFRFENVRLFVMANCGLTGSMPPWLSSSSKLQFLDLSWNLLSGVIPSSIGDLPYLFFLDLSNNSLSGSIPSRFAKLHSLINLNNSLKGEIFEGFSIFSRNNHYAGRQYKQLLRFPPSIDLSYNELSGIIWPEFGNLKDLRVLDLSNNKLSGKIPSTLSNLTDMERLDLSYNNLTGTIPPSLTNLNFLSLFNVAHNYLQGRIPLDGQFNTFPNSSFEGNDELCGFQTFPCEDESGSADDGNSIGEDEDESLRSLVRVPLGVGIAVGFVSTVAVCFYSGMVFPTEKKRRPR